MKCNDLLSEFNLGICGLLAQVTFEIMPQNMKNAQLFFRIGIA